MATIRRPEGVQIETGIPISHQQAFQSVANEENCIIMSRAVGHLCTSLILEGYASKGFHIKAKSCDWGPMAGFVLEDPNLTKDPNFLKQQEELKNAFKDHASAAKVAISHKRYEELKRLGLISMVRTTTAGILVRANRKGQVVDHSRSFPGYDFFLKRIETGMVGRLNAPSRYMYWVKYVSTRQFVHTGADIDKASSTHVYGMVNPPHLGGTAAGVRACVCGDYDLFSIAAHKGSYNLNYEMKDGVRLGEDVRRVPIVDVTQSIRGKDWAGAVSKEDKHLGNITLRLKRIRDKLNRAFKKKGYVGGNMVHHSDEAGRPMIDDIDLPVFAVAPRQKRPYALSKVEDLRQFLHLVVRDEYVFGLNPGWPAEISGAKIFATELSLAVMARMQRAGSAAKYTTRRG